MAQKTTFFKCALSLQHPFILIFNISRPFSPSKSNESWDDDGLPKIPANEIFNPPKSDEDSDDDECQPQQFRGRASTIGNGQIPRLARAPNIQRGTSVKNSDNSDKVNLNNYFKFNVCLSNWPSILILDSNHAGVSQNVTNERCIF